jgi:hypothetical protein
MPIKVDKFFFFKGTFLLKKDFIFNVIGIESQLGSITYVHLHHSGQRSLGGYLKQFIWQWTSAPGSFANSPVGTHSVLKRWNIKK